MSMVKNLILGVNSGFYFIYYLLRHFITNCENCDYKIQQLFYYKVSQTFITKYVSLLITKCGSYYKIRQFCYKMWQALKMWPFYYKMSQVLQNVKFIITKCDTHTELCSKTTSMDISTWFILWINFI